MCELTILDLASSNLISWTECLPPFQGLLLCG